MVARSAAEREEDSPDAVPWAVVTEVEWLDGERREAGLRAGAVVAGSEAEAAMQASERAAAGSGEAAESAAGVETGVRGAEASAAEEGSGEAAVAEGVAAGAAWEAAWEASERTMAAVGGLGAGKKQASLAAAADVETIEEEAKLAVGVAAAAAAAMGAAVGVMVAAAGLEGATAAGAGTEAAAAAGVEEGGSWTVGDDPVALLCDRGEQPLRGTLEH